MRFSEIHIPILYNVSYTIEKVHDAHPHPCHSAFDSVCLSNQSWGIHGHDRTQKLVWYFQNPRMERRSISARLGNFRISFHNDS